MNKVKPLKRFGQNYLTDKNILNKIADEIAPEEEDNLIEIGPGMGALTALLYGKTKNFTAVEIDKRVTEELKEKFPEINLISQDFMEVDLKELYSISNRKIRVAGNIPYYLTSPILFKLMENHKIVKDAVLMVQHEVAQRINAGRGTKDYGILAVLLQFFCDVKYCFKVSPNVFYPKPKVSSAVIHLYFKEINISDEEKIYFIKTVKAAFGHRRKTLKNSLSSGIFAGVDFSGSTLDLSKRAEQLSIDDFLNLAEYARKNSAAAHL